MNTIQVVLNYKDYEALPNDGRRYEIHEGELSVMPAPSLLHQETLGERSPHKRCLARPRRGWRRRVDPRLT